MPNAIVIFSGGLDSSLAVRILQEQGIGCRLLNIVTPFHDCSRFAAQQAAALGAPMEVFSTDDSYLQLIARPRWGYGKAINPCIDCRIVMCRAARELMERTGADFVATGEVVGQRPNSQKQHQLNLIERESGLAGHLLRPLSAQKLIPTLPEREGLVDRSRLAGFSGRGRTALIELAKKLGIAVIPQPSTGCLLCETSYAPRLRDLLRHESAPRKWDIDLLNSGRQLRLEERFKAVVGRNREQCERLQTLFHRPDARSALMLIPEGFNGPTVLLVGAVSLQELEISEPTTLNRLRRLAGALMLRFSNPDKFDPASVCATVHDASGVRLESLVSDPEADIFRVIGDR